MIRASLENVEQINAWVMRDSDLEVDFTPFLMNPMNVALVEGEGGAAFVWHGPGIYEVHVFFEQRGKEAIELSHRILSHMREAHGGRMFWAAVPYDNSKQSRKVRLFTRLMGWESKGRANLALGLHEIFSSEK